MKRQLASLILLLGLVTPPISTAQAEPVPEYAMKAAFLYNFALFTEWPERIDGKFNVCILGEAFSPDLESLNGKQVREGLPIAVTHISNLSNAQQCQILYFEAADRTRVSNAMSTLSSMPVLTVCDMMEANVPEAMIRLKLENSHLTFEVNQEAAHRAHLTFSSKMLRLARKVF